MVLKKILKDWKKKRDRALTLHITAMGLVKHADFEKQQGNEDYARRCLKQAHYYEKGALQCAIEGKEWPWYIRLLKNSEKCLAEMTA